MSGTPPAAHAVFGVLWAVGMLFHATVFHELLRPPLYAVLPLAALWLLLRPGSPPRLLLLAAAQIAVALYRMPVLPNHWLLSFFVDAAILCAFLRLALARRHLAVAGAELFRSFAPVARVMVLMLYFFATLHKLNLSYFSPELSCAVRELDALRGALPFVPDTQAVRWLAIFASVLSEAAIFALLLIPRCRTAGILLAGCFHLLLSLNVYHDFVSILFALLFLFTADSFPAEAAARLARLRDRLPARLARALPGAGRACGWALLAGMGLLALNDTRQPWAALYGIAERTLFFLYAPALLMLFAATEIRRGGRASYRWDALRIPFASLAIFPLLVALNGAAPYLGLKTEGSFAMFSNLRTEGGTTNHLLIPRALQLGGYDDLVNVLDTPIESLARLRDLGLGISYFELRSEASRNPEAGLRFVRHGQPRVLERVAEDPELSRPWPWLVRKLVRFRNVRQPYGSCQH